MKRSAGKMFVKIFTRSIIVVAILLTTCVLSYKAAVYIFQPKEEAELAYQDDVITDESDNNVKVEEIAKNLIFCYDDKSKNINKIVLEILNAKKNKLTYLTIPVNTKLTVSNSLYKRMMVDRPEIPQVLKLSALTKYLDFKKKFGYGTKITQELIGAEINYYTVIPQSLYETIFTDREVKSQDGQESVMQQVFTDDFRKHLKTLDSKKKLKAYIKELSSDVKSNLSAANKVKYADNYFNALTNDISYDVIMGINQNSGYTVDLEAAAKQLAQASSAQ